jgi:hypothetical protein
MSATSKLSTNELRFTTNGTTVAAKLDITPNTVTFNGASNALVTLTNLAIPENPFDAVNKSYVDGLVISGVTWKNAANAATTSADMTGSEYSTLSLGTITWTGSVPTIDGVTMVVGYRVVVKNNAATNGANSQGIYTVTSTTTDLVLTRSTDAASGSQANGSAIFVFAGSTNNDKAYVVTNDSPVNWGSGVVWSIMSSVPAVAGSDTQVQFNDSGVLGANSSFTFNKSTTTPTLAIGTTATGTTTLNLGNGSQASTISSIGTGLMTLSASGGFTATSGATSNVSLFGTTTSGTITLGNTTSGTGAITIGGLSSNISLGTTTSGTISIGSSGAGTMTLNNSSGMTIAGNSTSVSIGSSNSTTSNFNGVSIDIGSSSTTSLDLLSTGTSGTVNMTAGNGITTQPGGAISINAGNGGSTSGVGGNVLVQAGTSASVSNAGNTILKIAMAGTSTSTNNIIEFQSNSGSQLGRIENNGDIYAVSFNATSDARYKTNIEHLSDPLDKLKKIEGYSYKWKEDFVGYTDKLQYGVLAQQIEDAGLHHLVAGTENSKAVNYTGLIPLLIEAVKELSKKIENQVPKKVGRPKKI